MARLRGIADKNGGHTIPFTPEQEIEADTREQAWESGKEDRQWASVRAERDRKLADTDWSQLSDTPANTSNSWRKYRQDLRDITGQDDPFNIVWPGAGVAEES